MKLLQFNDSSAIAKISIDEDNGEVGIAFTSSPDKFYEFVCDDVDDFENEVNKIVEAQKSLGRFIAISRKDGTLTAV